MRKTLAFVLFLLLAGSVVRAAPPKAPSLRGAWQEVGGKCGTLIEKQDFYEFALDDLLPRQGEQCVASVGTDVVVFEANVGGAILDTPKQYLIVPMDRIVLRIQR